MHTDVLSYGDLLMVAKTAVAIGVEKIRVTGGEPLVRKGIIPFLEQVSQISGLKRLVLTTNGMLLSEMAEDLRCAGVESLNISLDSLRQDTFSSITRGGDVQRVLDGIKAAEKAGFSTIKINVVLMRGINDDEVADFAALTLDKPYRVRFIEYMPTVLDDQWKMRTMSGDEVLELVSRRFALRPLRRDSMDGPATYYQIDGAVGMIGLITPVSCHFCNECNRIRVTSTGIAKSCLFARETRDLKPYLRTHSELALRETLRLVVKDKPEHHAIVKGVRHHTSFAMSQVGG